MLQKFPRKSTYSVTGVLKGAIVAETAFVCLTAGAWYALCNYPGFHLAMYKNCRPVLNGFYYILERFSGESPRADDYKKWNVTKESLT